MAFICSMPLKEGESLTEQYPADIWMDAFEDEVARHALAVQVSWFEPSPRGLTGRYLLGVQLSADIGLVVAAESRISLDELKESGARSIASSMVADIHLGELKRLCDNGLRRRATEALN